MYKVRIKKSALKNLEKLPEKIKAKFRYLVADLSEKGVVQVNWPNFSSLGKNKYHCHLSYSYVACWQWAKKTIIIEVYYVGSREKAPY